MPSIVVWEDRLANSSKHVQIKMVDRTLFNLLFENLIYKCLVNLINQTSMSSSSYCSSSRMIRPSSEVLFYLHPQPIFTHPHYVSCILK